MLTLAIVAVVLGTTAWMWQDAAGRDFSGSKFADTRVKWLIGFLGLWIVSFPLYLLMRDSFSRPSASGGIGPLGAWAPPAAGATSTTPLSSRSTAVGTSVAPPPTRFRPPTG